MTPYITYYFPYGRYAMNGKMDAKNGMIRSAKEVARTAVFVAAVLAAQYVLSAVPFVEIVTLLFAVYAYSFGIARGVAAAVAFALLRQLLFGFYPVVLVLYLVHFSLLCVAFGSLKRSRLSGWRLCLAAVGTAILCTALFTLLDDLLTPLFYAYSPRAMKAYFYASLPFLFGQTVCAGVSVGALFLPLTRALETAKKV